MTSLVETISTHRIEVRGKGLVSMKTIIEARHNFRTLYPVLPEDLNLSPDAFMQLLSSFEATNFISADHIQGLLIKVDNELDGNDWTVGRASTITTIRRVK